MNPTTILAALVGVAAVLILSAAIASIPFVGHGRHASQVPASDFRAWLAPALRRVRRRLAIWARTRVLYVPSVIARRVRAQWRQRRAVSA